MKWNLWSLIFQGRESCTPLPAGMGRFGRGGFSLDQCFPELGEAEGSFFNQSENQL